MKLVSLKKRIKEISPIPKYLTKPPLFITVAFLLVALFAPEPFVLISPGPVTNLLAGHISLAGSNTDKAVAGSLFSTSVLVNSPNSKPNGIEVIRGWIDGQISVVPWEAVYPKSQSAKNEISTSKKEMLDSQGNAAIAAANFLSNISPNSPALFKPTDVKIEMKDVSGPSAGLAFAIAIIAKFADPQLIAGRKIAVTGTISQSGVVGAIGGINQKLNGAKSAGAEIFIAPKANCQDFTHLPTGLKLIAVANLTQAIHALADSRIADNLHC